MSGYVGGLLIVTALSLTSPARAIEVVGSAPVAGAADVPLGASVRLLFSGDVDEASVTGRIRIAYSATDSADRGEPEPPAIRFTARYDPGNRTLEIRSTQPWARFREVTVELMDGIRGRDGASVKPFSLTFATGGS